MIRCNCKLIFTKFKKEEVFEMLIIARICFGGFVFFGILRNVLGTLNNEAMLCLLAIAALGVLSYLEVIAKTKKK